MLQYASLLERFETLKGVKWATQKKGVASSFLDEERCLSTTWLGCSLGKYRHSVKVLLASKTTGF